MKLSAHHTGSGLPLFLVHGLRASAAFSDAELPWFEQSGHFPVWDEPAQTVRLVLERTAARPSG